MLSTIYRLHQLVPKQVKDGRLYLLVAGIQLHLLLLLQMKVYLGDCPHGIGFPDLKVVSNKDVPWVGKVVGSTGSHWKKCGGVEGRSKLGVAEDSTLGKSHLYKATPTPIMWSLPISLSKLSFPPILILAMLDDCLRSPAMSFLIVLTHPFITWTIFLLIVLSRPTFPLFSSLSDDPHSPTFTPLAY